MKHLLFMLALTLAGAIGSLTDAFWAVLLYYTIAVLRPNHLWQWSMPVEWRWSLTAAVIVFVAYFIHMRRLSAKARLNPVVGLMLLYWLWVTLSCLTAHDTAIAMSWAFEYAKIFIIATLATWSITHLPQVHWLGAMIAVGVGFVAWEVNSLYIFQGRLDIFHYGICGLDNNGAGLYLATGLPFAYAYATSAPKLWHRGLMAVLLVLILHAILMSYSRGAMIAGLVGILFLLWNHRPKWQAAGLGIGMSMLVLFLAGEEIRERFLSSARFQTDGSAQNRLESWAAAWNIAWDNPLLGTGIRNSNLYSFNYGADRMGRTIHNLYLQIAADSGFPAMLLHIGILAAAAWGLTRCRGMCRRHLEQLPAGSEAYGTLFRAERLSVAMQGSLLIFAVASTFLSVEMIELPWLMLMMAGVMPRCLRDQLRDLSLPMQPEPMAQAKPESPPKPVLAMARIHPGAMP